MKPLLHSDLPTLDTYVPLSTFRPCVANLSANPGADIVRYTRSRADVLALGQGQGDAATPEFICRAVERALAEGHTFYDSALGLDALRREISEYYARIYGFDIPVNRIAVTSSGTTAMHLSFSAILEKGDETVAVTPIWRNLLSAVELAQASVKEVALDNTDGHWHLDLQKLFSSVSPKTRALLITTPSNPTGWVMPRDQVRAVMEFARERGLWIVADEVYSRLTYDSAHAPSFLEFATPEDRIFVVNSFSKAWAMTGWRLGWMVMPDHAEAHIRDIALYNNMGPPTFTQYGAIEALKSGEDFIRRQIDLWRGNRDYLARRFAAMPRIRADHPQSAFYSFFKVEGEDDCVAFCRGLIDKAGLSLAPGCGFGKVGRGYIRMCFAVSRPRLEDALNRLESIL